jgi:hypothetical protein
VHPHADVRGWATPRGSDRPPSLLTCLRGPLSSDRAPPSPGLDPGPSIARRRATDSTTSPSPRGNRQAPPNAGSVTVRGARADGRLRDSWLGLEARAHRVAGCLPYHFRGLYKTISAGGPAGAAAQISPARCRAWRVGGRSRASTRSPWRGRSRSGLYWRRPSTAPSAAPGDMATASMGRRSAGLCGSRRRPRGGDSGHARHSSRSPRHRTRRWAWARCRTPRGVAPRPNVIDGSDEPADPPMSARHWLMVWRWHWTHPQPGRAPRRRVEAAEAPQSFHHTYGDSARPDTMLEMAPDRFRNPPHPSGTKT